MKYIFDNNLKQTVSGVFFNIKQNKNTMLTMKQDKKVKQKYYTMNR